MKMIQEYMNENDYQKIYFDKEFDAGIISIKDLRKKLTELAKKFDGEDTLIRFDAGYNNISLEVVKPKPVKEKKKITVKSYSYYR